MLRFLGVSFFFFCLFLDFSAIAADEPVFAENADEMVAQLVKKSEPFGKSRSFVVEPTRSISVRAKNKQGSAETMTIVIPQKTIAEGARLKVEFDINSSHLRPSAYRILGELALALQDERIAGNTICVKGHTDSDGDEDYNLTLSYERAGSVKDYLTGAIGLTEDSLSIYGYGESLPLVDNESPADKQKNRRVEVSLNCPEIGSVAQ